MVNPKKIVSLLDSLKGYLDTLHRHAGTPRDVFLRDSDALDSAKYNFIVAIENCIDIGNHIIASEGLRLPSDYRDVAQVLAESDVIGPDLAERFKSMVSFRNRLVHMYWKVDDELVREYLENNLDDISAQAFARTISSQ